MIKIAVVDDEKTFLEIFQKKLELEICKQKLNCSIFTFHGGLDFLPHINEYDVIFLDVDMPNISGKDIAAMVRDAGKESLVIFITNYDDFVFSSFKYKPFEFIRKRYMYKELPDVLGEVSKFFRKNNSLFTFSFDGAALTLNQRDIIYFEVYGHQIYVHTSNRQYILNEPLAKIENRVSDYMFVKPHKSFLVNVKHIFSVDKDKIILKTEKTIPISRHRVSEVKQKMIEFSER